ncbi:IPExxxVDY family protein [Flavobacteriaceae bacterium TK19130]|nr:IPExxxVDY family protein [Thermobacterium salinum]
MGLHKLVLDDDLGETFSLVAIHCSVEAYKMGFLLNKFAHLKLTRSRLDLDFSKDGLEVMFPLFQFYDSNRYIQYHLVANICQSVTARLAASGGLFSEDRTEQQQIHYLMPDFKKVDYFLKLSSDGDTVPLRKLLLEINEIPAVISAYQIHADNLKYKQNLIFE